MFVSYFKAIKSINSVLNGLFRSTNICEEYDDKDRSGFLVPGVSIKTQEVRMDNFHTLA